MSKQITEALGSLLKDLKAKFNTEEQAFIVVKTTDGAELTLDGDLVVGARVTTKDAECTVCPAADGTYTLADGTTMEVKNGAIAELSTPAEEVTEPEMGKEVASQLSAISEAINTIADKFSALSESNEALKNRVDELEKKEVTGFAKESELAEVKESFAKLLPILEGLVTEPANEPVQVEKNVFSKQENKTKKLINLSETLSKIK